MIHVKVTNATAIYPVEKIPKTTREKVRARLTFENPKWLENEKHGYWNGDTPRELCFLEQENGRLTVPRGFTRQLLKVLLDDGGVHFQIEDSRRELEPVDFRFTAELRGYQEQAVREMSRRDFGTLSAPTGSGKTVIALALVAERIAERAGIPYRRVFKDHSRGKRLFLGAKFQEIETDFLEEVRGVKILVFDDFAYTRYTMVKSLAVLRAAGNEAEGVVLLAS